MSISNRHTPIAEYDFGLPKELIAQEPLRNREDARLMIVNRTTDSIDHSHIRDLPSHLARGDCLVINETKVVLAKLIGYRTKTGGRWQGLYLESDPGGIWRVLAKTRGKLQPGETVTLRDRNGAERCTLTMLARLEGGAWAAKPDRDVPAQQLLDEIGHVPLPHYIRGGNMVESDLTNYQTVFAREAGSIAAPTAGLHFTDKLLNQLESNGISVCRVILHVGIGTFRPIETNTVEQHRMHEEYGEITEPAARSIAATRSQGGRVIAVGSTSVRLLETAARDDQITAWHGNTDLYIHPPYQFKCVDALLTNFHLPRTSLLVMARTFGGDQLIRRAYEEAVQQKYRFFSYGDAMLIF